MVWLARLSSAVHALPYAAAQELKTVMAPGDDLEVTLVPMRQSG
jgi:hypothetical protein